MSSPSLERIMLSIFWQFSRIPSSRMAFRAATPAAVAKGFPPNVEAWSPGLKLSRNPFPEQQGADGDTPCQGLGKGEDIGLDPIVLIGKEFSRPAHPHLNLIEDQEKSFSRRRSPEGPSDNPRTGSSPLPPPESARRRWRRFSNRWLYDGLGIVKGNILKPRHQGLITLMKLFLSRCGQGGKRPSMEGALHGDDLVPISHRFLLRIFPGQFDRPFVGLSAAVAEEDFPANECWTEKGGQAGSAARYNRSSRHGSASLPDPGSP